MRLVFALTLFAVVGSAQSIEPWAENRFYWSRGGEPVLLAGGSDDDNLFQWPDERLREQLDLMKEVGANYVRNTMSDRPDGGFEVYPFYRRADGKYDLERWNPEYWRRFERFLQWTEERGVVVQIEVWDRFDYTSNRGDGRWKTHPYHPANNVNYTAEESGFADEYPDHPGRNKQPFFFTTPEQRNNQTVLRHQERFVDRLLETSLKFGHVLYCIDNETRGEEAWGRHWARHIRKRAEEAGVWVYITEMWDDWDLKGEEHRRTLDHPELYDFADVSQNNQQKEGQPHWDNFQWVRRYVAGSPRPLNTVKTYGADGNKFGHADDDGVARIWRHVLGGAAAVRFHRPPSGLGLGEKARGVIEAVRAVEREVRYWELEPAQERLLERDLNEAYASAQGDEAFVVYFPAGGQVGWKTAPGEFEVRWLDGVTGRTEERGSMTSRGSLPLAAPAEGHWIAVGRRR